MNRGLLVSRIEPWNFVLIMINVEMRKEIIFIEMITGKFWGSHRCYHYKTGDFLRLALSSQFLLLGSPRKLEHFGNVIDDGKATKKRK